MTALALKAHNVIQLPGGRRVRLDSPAAVKLVQSEILASGRFYRDIAYDAEISSVTVGNIASGATHRPSFNTIAAILGALGWSIFAERD